jgi:hypothetical protein
MIVPKASVWERSTLPLLPPPRPSHDQHTREDDQCYQPELCQANRRYHLGSLQLDASEDALSAEEVPSVNATSRPSPVQLQTMTQTVAITIKFFLRPWGTQISAPTA